ncbi:hypothetical protein, partial [Amaricoccus sp.]|uniref:hypothetical protein n=1 Tax=Amaricoccus sp. TaxID=1872485 RepID=UPI002C6E9016
MEKLVIVKMAKPAPPLVAQDRRRVRSCQRAGGLRAGRSDLAFLSSSTVPLKDECSARLGWGAGRALPGGARRAGWWRQARPDL